MIYVSRINGEGFDFGTGGEVPKTLVLTNGVSEVSIHVSDKDVMAILKLHTDSSGSAAKASVLAETDSTSSTYRSSKTFTMVDAPSESTEVVPDVSYADPISGTDSI